MTRGCAAIIKTISGLKYDAPGCGHIDPSIPREAFEQYIDAPCPKCGAPLLTLADYKLCLALDTVIDLVNAVVGDVPESDCPRPRFHLEMDGTGKLTIYPPKTGGTGA